VFYTIHIEDPATQAPAAPRNGVVPELGLSTYATTPAIEVPTVNGRIDREAVLVEWTDRDTSNATLEGTAREVMRLQQPLPVHPMGEMTFNPVARPGDADWRVMYIGSGDAGTGEQRDARRLNPPAARHAARQDPAHRARSRRAHVHEHGQRQRTIPHPR
jgi:hypothetical protein